MKTARLRACCRRRGRLILVLRAGQQLGRGVLRHRSLSRPARGSTQGSIWEQRTPSRRHSRHPCWSKGRLAMQVLYPCCCGIDVANKFVVACLLTTADDGTVRKETRTFGTMTLDLLVLLDWLTAAGCTHVAMECTSAYWRPLYNILEGHLVVWVANAFHIKAVPGRKTDVKDAESIADLLRHGLLRPSFIPPPAQRHLR